MILTGNEEDIMYQSNIAAEDSLRADFERACTTIIGKIDLIEDRISRPRELNHKGLRVLRLALVDGWINEAWLRHAVQTIIIRTGRRCFEQSQHKGYTVWADHVSCPAALAFAMIHDDMVRANIGNIKFDHGETPKVFMGRADGFLEKIVFELTSLIERVDMPVF